MTKIPPPPTPERNRLRAAAALVPIIESGLDGGKLTEDKASQMIRFCEWTMNSEATDQDETALKVAIRNGLVRLEARLRPEVQASDP